MALESTELTSDLLHALFEYRDGKLFWRARNGKEAGCVGNRGYSCVCINYRKYMTHRLIWIMHGNDPVPMLDHINGDQLDNRIDNLRPANASQNQRNQKLRRDSTSGLKGVSWINATSVGPVRFGTRAGSTELALSRTRTSALLLWRN